MLVQYYFPHALSPSRLDRYLAGGWFRGANMLYRSQLICLENDLFSVVNVRLPLVQHGFSRNQRRLLRRNDARFRIEVGRATTNSRRESLYQSMQERFHGFIFPTLEEFLFSDGWQPVFDTRELAVYDGDRLVAVSYWDRGRHSAASILALYDPDYAEYSLGIYTMLAEVRYAKAAGLRYYYPGYVLDGFPGFTYKLRLGTHQLQYYDWSGHWRPFVRRDAGQGVSERIKGRVAALERSLSAHNIKYERVVNPFFAVGYLEEYFEEFLLSGLYLICYPRPEAKRCLVVEYRAEEDVFVICWAVERHRYEELFPDEMISHFDDETMRLLSYDQILMYNTEVEATARELARLRM